MKKTHQIKLNINFAHDVLSGRKCFEVRLNDRGYQTGDEVQFIVVNNEGNRLYHVLDEEKFVITYVLSGWGINPDYVVFGIKRRNDETEDSSNVMAGICEKNTNTVLKDNESEKGLKPIGLNTTGLIEKGAGLV